MLQRVTACSVVFSLFLTSSTYAAQPLRFYYRGAEISVIQGNTKSSSDFLVGSQRLTHNQSVLLSDGKSLHASVQGDIIKNSHDFAPYGNSHTLDLTFGYNGEYVDSATQLVYLRVRDYQPTSQRFLVADSYALWNRYNFANSNPIANIDPSGHLTKTQWIGIGIGIGVVGLALVGGIGYGAYRFGYMRGIKSVQELSARTESEVSIENGSEHRMSLSSEFSVPSEDEKFDEGSKSISDYAHFERTSGFRQSVFMQKLSPMRNLQYRIYLQAVYRYFGEAKTQVDLLTDWAMHEYPNESAFHVQLSEFSTKLSRLQENFSSRVTALVMDEAYEEIDPRIQELTNLTEGQSERLGGLIQDFQTGVQNQIKDFASPWHRRHANKILASLNNMPDVPNWREYA